MGVCYRMLGERAAAEDATQETFLRLWTNAARWEPRRGASLRAWLTRVAMNICLDRLRRRAREAPADAAPESADDAPRADEAMIAADARDAVAAAIAGLPPRQRQAIVLCHYEERSNIEAAEIMETSVEAMESLLARGRRALRAALAPRRNELMEETGS